MKKIKKVVKFVISFAQPAIINQIIVLVVQPTVFMYHYANVKMVSLIIKNLIVVNAKNNAKLVQKLKAIAYHV